MSKSKPLKISDVSKGRNCFRLNCTDGIMDYTASSEGYVRKGAEVHLDETSFPMWPDGEDINTLLRKIGTFRALKEDDTFEKNLEAQGAEIYLENFGVFTFHKNPSPQLYALVSTVFYFLQYSAEFEKEGTVFTIKLSNTAKTNPLWSYRLGRFTERLQSHWVHYELTLYGNAMKMGKAKGPKESGAKRKERKQDRIDAVNFFIKEENLEQEAKTNKSALAHTIIDLINQLIVLRSSTIPEQDYEFCVDDRGKKRHFNTDAVIVLKDLIMADGNPIKHNTLRSYISDAYRN